MTRKAIAKVPTYVPTLYARQRASATRLAVVISAQVWLTDSAPTQTPTLIARTTGTCTNPINVGGTCDDGRKKTGTAEANFCVHI